MSVASGPGLALFPGAFRPPHRAHFETVKYLVGRADVNEVVIVITSRSRQVPGTNLALAPSVAREVWAVYLQGMDRVRVEMAPGSAVRHALAYFEKSKPGQRLFFCAGANELNDEGGRFRKIHGLSRRYDIPAAIVPSPVNPLSGRATSVRAHLARGEEGCEAFMASLPGHLTSEQRLQVWLICRRGMRPMAELAGERIVSVFERRNLGRIVTMEVASSGKTDEVFRVGLEGGSRVFVKSAHDTPRAARWGDPYGLKPRRRVHVERQALKWLASRVPDGVELPQVVDFDNPTRTLVLTEVRPEGRALQRQLEQGRFDPEIAVQIAAFLAHCHGLTGPIPAFWGSDVADMAHWHAMLRLHTEALHKGSVPLRIAFPMKELQLESLKASRPGFFHLDFSPENILFDPKGMGVIDFERCCSVGDPAFDLGLLLGHYWFWGIATASERDCQIAVRAMMETYLQQSGNHDSHWSGRVCGFALLQQIQFAQNQSCSAVLKERRIERAASLLACRNRDSIFSCLVDPVL